MADLMVATIGALLVGMGMAWVAYFQNFIRGYYIAILMMLAGFLMLYLNQLVYPVVLGIMINLPGLVLLIRFLQKYPQPSWEVDDKHP
jgi:hypothetical protein